MRHGTYVKPVKYGQNRNPLQCYGLPCQNTCQDNSPFGQVSAQKNTLQEVNEC